MRALVLLLGLLLATWVQAQSLHLLSDSRVLANPDISVQDASEHPFAELQPYFSRHESRLWHSQAQPVNHWFAVTLPADLLSANRVIIRANNDQVRITDLWSEVPARAARLTDNHLSVVPNGSGQAIYLLLQSDYPVSFSLLASDLDQYWYIQRQEHLNQGIFFGTLLLVIALLLWLSWQRQQWLFAIGACYTLCWLLYFIGLWLPWPGMQPRLSTELVFLLSLTCFQLILFSVVRFRLSRLQQRLLLTSLSLALAVHLLGLRVAWAAIDLPLLQTQCLLAYLWLLNRGYSSYLPAQNRLLLTAVGLALLTLLLHFDHQGMALFHNQQSWLYPLLCLAHLAILFQALATLTGKGQYLPIANASAPNFPLLLSDLTDELRNQAQVVFGMTDVLQQSKLDEHQQQCTERLQLSASHLIHLNRELTALQSSQLPPTNASFNLLQLVRDSLLQCQSSQRVHNIEVRLNAQALQASQRLGDPTLLKAILSILLSKAMERDCKGRPVAITLLDKGSSDVQISVRSAGFHPRSKLSTVHLLQPQTSPKGLGLGMAQFLLLQLAGDIQLRQEEQGLCFLLSVPLGIDNLPRPAEPPMLPLPTQRVLLVDGDLPLQNFLRSQLESDGHQLDTLTDSSQTCQRLLDACQHHPYDLVLIGHDHQQDGIDLLQQVHLQPVWPRPKALILLNALELDADQALLAQEFSQLQLRKPLFVVDMQPKLLALLQRLNLIDTPEDDG